MNWLHIVYINVSNLDDLKTRTRKGGFSIGHIAKPAASEYNGHRNRNQNAGRANTAADICLSFGKYATGLDIIASDWKDKNQNK